MHLIADKRITSKFLLKGKYQDRKNQELQIFIVVKF